MNYRYEVLFWSSLAQGGRVGKMDLLKIFVKWTSSEWHVCPWTDPLKCQGMTYIGASLLELEQHWSAATYESTCALSVARMHHFLSACL